MRNCGKPGMGHPEHSPQEMGGKGHSPSPLVKCVGALKARRNVAVAGVCTIAERVVRRKIGRGINRLVNNLSSCLLDFYFFIFSFIIVFKVGMHRLLMKYDHIL